MNNIFDNVNYDTCLWKNYLAIFKHKKLVNHKDKIKGLIQESTEELAEYFQRIPSDIDNIFASLQNH